MCLEYLFVFTLIKECIVLLQKIIDIALTHLLRFLCLLVGPIAIN